MTAKPRKPKPKFLSLDEARAALERADAGAREAKEQARSAKSKLKAAKKACKRVDKAAKKARKDFRKARRTLEHLIAHQAEANVRAKARRRTVRRKPAVTAGLVVTPMAAAPTGDGR
jgi:3-oxoacyl-[acyl-carrier-protein] synthase III